MNYPKHLQKIIETLKKFPGVGNKTAERFAFDLISWKKEDLKAFETLISNIPSELTRCSDCGCVQGDASCSFCKPHRLATKNLCVIASPKDAFAIEATHEFRGVYHVLEGLISPLQGIGPGSIGADQLLLRINSLNIEEVILALDASLEGDATALYIKKELASSPVHVSRLAFGIPLGSSLDYVDGSTLARALSGRSLV